MGILNVTPDSFSDGGRYFYKQAAMGHARQMISEGATIIDVGGESTRPGAAAVSVQEELDRVIPIIEELRAESSLFISIDTSKPEVMRAAVQAGADIINDVRALTVPGALAAAAESTAAVCLMHMQGEPGTMQAAPTYDNVVTEVTAYLQQRASDCVAAGIQRQRLVIDPGIGFGKSVQHNFQLLAQLRALHVLNMPILIGVSRKSLIGNVLGRPVDKRLPASLALATASALAGASIIRCHDVQATVDALAMVHHLRVAGYAAQPLN